MSAGVTGAGRAHLVLALTSVLPFVIGTAVLVLAESFRVGDRMSVEGLV